MTTNYLDILTHVLRQPRHVANGQTSLRVEFQRGETALAGDDAPQILDFSRGGCRLLWSDRLDDSEEVVIRLCDTVSGLTLEVAASVRWCEPTPQGQFAAGCQFDRELDYEQLGELFLAGFLSTEEAR